MTSALDAVLAVRPPHDPETPTRRPGEDWASFYDRWAASPQGRARVAWSRRLNEILGPLHAAEKAGKFLADEF